MAYPNGPYTQPTRLALFGANPNALLKVSNDEQVAACQAASDTLDTYFRPRYPLPFVSVNDTAIELRAAHIAIWLLLSQRGRNPEAGYDDQIDERYKEAIEWAKQIQRQDGMLNVTVNQPSSPNYNFPAVLSGRPRGWTRRH